MSKVFTFLEGAKPLLVSFPHSSTMIPSALAERMTEEGRGASDTDWDLPQLYNFLPPVGASVIIAEFSRYVIDVNRSTDGENLYPGQPTPLLCPVNCFDGTLVYWPGQEPGQTEIDRRTALYWQPYHDKIHEELVRIRDQFGIAVLFDAHSIRSRVPRLFEGQLPDINIGTAYGNSCDQSLEIRIEDCLKSQSVCSYVINGRFVGGYITRHHGRPIDRVHAVQLELSQARYMDEGTGLWNDERAQETRVVLREVISAILNWIDEQN